MSRHVILTVLDGLRPDSVCDALTPHMAALALAGVKFTNHHQANAVTMIEDQER